MPKFNIWHVITMDSYVTGPYRGQGSLIACRDEIRGFTNDWRASDSGFKKIDDDTYKHTPPRDFQGDNWTTYYIVRDSALKDWAAPYEQYQQKLAGRK